MRLLLITISLFSLFFFWVNLVSAESTATSSSTVNSYELFWPLAAGRTEDDTLYFLKILKEQIMGIFLFDDTKKADYAIELGTKRVLETEKLLKSGKVNLALNALEKGGTQYTLAYELIKKADSKKKFSASGIRRDRLTNVKRLVDYLRTTSDEKTYPSLSKVKEKVDALLSDYLP